MPDISSGEKIQIVERILSRRSLERRIRLEIPIDEWDLPVNPQYLDEIQSIGVKIYRISRWLNAVSVYADNNQLSRISTFDYVKNIRPVVVYRRGHNGGVEEVTAEAVYEDSLYGPSFGQLNQIGIVGMHRLGYNGEGILISIFDSGFLYHHSTFEYARLENRFVAMHDFINNDNDVEDGDDLQRRHGTTTLSTIAGSTARVLLGGAYKSDFALAKTEIVTGEVRIEEDNWVAAAEWSDSIGADIISSSLGYNEWYTYEEMDGNTAVTTIAADIAASRGILVVNSAGNEGDDPWRYIISPADGDSVLAVGAVDADGSRTNFSSFGPTYDGRIKPDVMALGRNVRCALATSPTSFGYNTGTSLAAPLVASAAALVLQAKPGLNPKALIDSIHFYASRSTNPDNEYGWGIMNTLKTSGSFRITSSKTTVLSGGEEFTATVYIGGPNGPYSGELVEFEASPLGLSHSTTIYNPAPGFYALNFTTNQIPGIYRIKATDQTLNVADSIYIKVVGPQIDYTQNFYNSPNPFDSYTYFNFYLDSPEITKISIFNISGRLVKKIVIPSANLQSGINRYRWDADNNFGIKIAGGVYICTIDTPTYKTDTKAVLIK
ncbi:MAG: S8 family serine peptidase [candidate division Zixibacteria bacterium]|nr:S8 family serine peptidase [candidate division Zixibacteria bacterium]